jgi:integrase
MPTPAKTLRDAGRSWLRTCERNDLERSTLKSYRSHITIHIEPRIGDLLLADVSRAQIRDFLDDLLDAGVSHAQAKKIMVSLRAVLSEALEREWVAQNVALDVKVRRKTRAMGDMRVIPSKEEIRLIIDNAPAAHRALFVTAIFTGMRISELRGLTWGNVDLDRKLIRVLQRADEFQQIGPPKSRAGVRDIPMAPLVHQTLTQWLERVPKSDLNLVFPNSVGKVQSYSNLYSRVFRPMLIENGITDARGRARFGIHALRHAAASLFIEQGWNPKKIQTLLGHASITMTMDVYGHLFETADEDVSMFAKLERDLLAA